MNPLPEMTWEELAAIIAQMTPEQRAQPVKGRSINQEINTNARWQADKQQLYFQDYHLDPEWAEKFDC